MNGQKHDPREPFSFQINFAPQQILANAEEELKKAMRNRTSREIDDFFGEKTEYTGNNTLKKTPGAGLLLIRDFLQKKFDDAKTQEKMQKYFEENFDRIMEEAMQKALQHKANAFVFNRAKDHPHDAGSTG